MASAQVLPKPKKLGHLEAGKKKLEEFRKKKAEGRAQKAASTDQLVSTDADQNGKVSQKYEHEKDGAKFAVDITNSYGLDISGEDKAVTFSIPSSNLAHDSSPVLVDNNHPAYGKSIQYAEKKEPKSYERSGFPELVNGYHDDQNRSSQLSANKNSIIEPPAIGATDRFDPFNPVKANANLQMNIRTSSSLFKVPPAEDTNSSNCHSSYPEASFANSFGTSDNQERPSMQNRLGLSSSSAYTSGSHKELSLDVEYSPLGSLNRNNSSNFATGGAKITESFDSNLHVNETEGNVSESSYKDSSSADKSSRYEFAFASTGSGTSSGYPRSSFLDALGVSRASSMAYIPYGGPEKDNTSGTFDFLKVQQIEVPITSSHAPIFNDFNVADQSLKSSVPDYKSDSEFTLVSSNDENLPKPIEVHHVQSNHELFTSKKDENFAALEQHIEDLTQEKFSLQRALEASRTLAESLASENSSLTESYNQQGRTVSQLKSDIERLQEEIKAQLLALETIRSEYFNAQQECNAADERAKVLASEVISLEEKALKLRSNELKLEKQLENLSSEIASYKRKVSILEKERQDFQLTIDALQEERKLLQSKLRKVSTDDKFNLKKASTGRDVSVSTEDLGIEPFNLVGGETSISNQMLTDAIIPAQDSATTSQSADASTSTLVPEDMAFSSNVSRDIPHDQLRMIDNINSLISELALEKEELVGALKIESSNCAKLKNLNQDLSQKLEIQTQRLELLTAQCMANESVLARPAETHSRRQHTTQYADEGDEVVERVLGWIMKLFPGGPSKRHTSKLI